MAEEEVAEAAKLYRAVSERLRKDFLTELRRITRVAATNAGRFPSAKPGLHRANLRRFPYHFFYRETAGGIFVTLVRHHKRHPSYGEDRN